MAAEAVPTIRVFWRPGCFWCSALRHAMQASGLPFTEINIWADGDAARFVRSVARGNETVPTVLVGGRALVNPSMRKVMAAVRTETPELAALLPAPKPGPLARLAARLRHRARPPDAHDERKDS